MVQERSYDSVVEFISSSPTPQQIIAFRPSDEVQQRVEDLLYKKKTGQLDTDEVVELDRFMFVEHIMIIAKKKAKKSLI